MPVPHDHNATQAKGLQCPVSKADRRLIVRWTKRLGVAGVVFFTLKGLAWLTVAALVALGIIGR